MFEALRHGILTQGMTVSSYLGLVRAKAIVLLQESKKWTKKDLLEYQERALGALMRHCYDHVPYYADLMRARSLRPEDFRRVSDLPKLPYLTRDIIRREGTRLRADNYPDSVCKFRRSGGTTGEPIKVAVDARARAFEFGAYLRGLEWMKYNLGRPRVCLFGGSLGMQDRSTLSSKMKTWILNTRLLPAFELKPENVGTYLQVIRKAKGGILLGYASAVRNLAEYMVRAGFRGSPLQSVICTAEFMPDEWRERIGEVLQVPVYCYYGCGEVNSIAYESSEADDYIVSEEHVILEVGGPDPKDFRDQGRGEACITTLFNYAMPLLRYLNGDILELKRPSSGYPHGRITKLEGRVADQLMATDGHMVSGALPPHLVLKSAVPVWKYQVVQEKVDRIVFHYLMADNGILTPPMKQTLTTVLRTYLGQDMDISFVTGQFEVPPSGKHRFVINKVKYNHNMRQVVQA
jgi:phenylacetate-CoA ligase